MAAAAASLWFGGRWNPPLLFPAIYLADSARAGMVEVERLLGRRRPAYVSEFADGGAEGSVLGE
jgi:RES domain-containing protein